MKNKLYVVAGPTAVGKTKYSINLAKKVNGEIVSLDSVQVYKYLDIGSAKITKEEMDGIKHYMIDEVEPNVNLNVKEFKDRANKYIEDIIKRNKTPILVGGSGFYIRAVLFDTDFLEENEEKSIEIRKDLYDLIEKNGIDYVYNELKTIDIESAIKIPKENVKRVVRALEFFKIHGKKISTHNEIEKSKESKYDYDFYVLNMDREKLYDKINRRVDKMIENGLLDEESKLIDMGLSKELNSMRSIGYAELYDFVKNNKKFIDKKILTFNLKNELNAIIELIKQHSRNYAKRQLTWFRAQKKITWIDVENN